MAALNFIAIEDGLEEDSKVLSLARGLKVSRPLAVWYVLRLRRFVMSSGDHKAGVLPKRYNAEDIASFLEFQGKSRVLVDALKKQGFLSFRKGKGFAYPGWRDTVTGRYAIRREEDRLWHEQQRKKDRSTRQSSEVARPSADASADIVTTSSRILTERKKERESGHPPVPPPGGGAILAEERWGWIEQNAPTPQNREVCKRLLETMDPEDWTRVQYAYGLASQPRSLVGVKNFRVLTWATDVFLRKQAYLRFHPAGRSIIKARKAPMADPVSGVPEASKEQKAATSWEFLRQYLEDNWPEHEKAKRKKHYFEQFGSKPWENSQKQHHKEGKKAA